MIALINCAESLCLNIIFNIVYIPRPDILRPGNQLVSTSILYSRNKQPDHGTQIIIRV